MMKTKTFSTLVLFLVISTALALNPENFVFKAGESGYFCFRAPTMVVTTAGTILAFSEGRVNSTADEGDMDIVMKRP
jgi:sialidase-1